MQAQAGGEPVVRCLITDAGQDAPPTMGVGPEQVPLRPMNPRFIGIKKRATTI